MLNKDQLLLAVDNAKTALDALPSLGEVTTASLNFVQGYLQKKKLVFTANKGQNLPDFGLYY